MKKTTRLLCWMVGSFMLPGAVSAQVLKVDLEKDLKSTGQVNLYDRGIDQTISKQSGLAKLKFYEIRGKWADCAQAAPQVFKSHKELQGWVLLTWLGCVEKDRTKTKSFDRTQKALEMADHQERLRAQGPWAKELDQAWLDARYALVQNLFEKKSLVGAAHNAELLLLESSRLSKDQRSLLYQVLGEQALFKKDYQEARFFFAESLDQKETSAVKEKLDFATKALYPTEKIEPAAAVTVAGTEPLSEDEVIEERVRASLKQNDFVVAAKDSVLILNQYAGSKAAKRLKDKPLEIYNMVAESGREKILSQMQEADASRVLDWAHNLHRRADYKGSLYLAQKAMAKNPHSPQMVSFLWIAGRSAHFLGQYELAQEYYKKTIETQSGSDEAAEALMRSALIFFRQKDFGSTTARLEKLMVLKKDRYDLNGQYWMVRALEQIAPDRAKVAAAQLIEKYPFSYYGLRLAAEQNQQKYTWPTFAAPAKKLSGVIYLAGEQVPAWKRFVSLSSAGWVREAQAELNQRPFIADASVKILLAQRLAERTQFPTAIRLVNEAFESDINLRRPEYLKISFPQIFNATFEQEAQRYDLSPTLVKSLVRQESAFNLRAVSTSNALGLMQMIPPTAQEVAKKMALKIELPEDMFRPEINIPMGTFYLAQVLNQFNENVPMALASYNAGPTRLKIWLDSRPETSELMAKKSSAVEDEIWFDELPWTETSFYIKAILRNTLIYKLIEKGEFTANPVLWQDLLNKKAK